MPFAHNEQVASLEFVPGDKRWTFEELKKFSKEELVMIVVRLIAVIHKKNNQYSEMKEKYREQMKHD